MTRAMIISHRIEDLVPAPCGAFLHVLLLLFSLSSAAVAQRAQDNAVTAATDAFGASIGRESIGIYTPDIVRGFSAIDAGNARLDGLYFDPVRLPSPRLTSATAIRVGISAQGFLLPAPTGVIDYSLRHPGSVLKGSAYASVDSYGNATLEGDAEIPLIADTLSMGIGLSDNYESYYNRTSDRNRTEAVLMEWKATSTLKVFAFWSQYDMYDAGAPPLYISAGDFAPPYIERRQFNGPMWAVGSISAANDGAIASWAFAKNWLAQGGVFYSETRSPLTYTNLYLDLTRDGRARQFLFVDPHPSNSSVSGEIRLSHSFDVAGEPQTVHLAFRGRYRERRYDGTDEIDLGTVSLGEPQPAPRPPFHFTQQDHALIEQETVGLAWVGRWSDRLAFSSSLQSTSYEKRVQLAAAAAPRISAAPVLFNLASTVNLMSRVSLYGSYTRGLEDSGEAPASAANRNEPLPASGTTQADAGVQLQISSALHFVAGAFQIRKPYFEFNADNQFTLLGNIINSGIEASLSGAPTPQLTIVAGAQVGRPRVSGTGAQLGLVGREPVDKPAAHAELDLDWRPVQAPQLSLDAGVTYVSRKVATINEAVTLPARLLVNGGARYTIRSAGKPFQLRLAVTNLLNVYGFDLYGSGVYDIIAGRVVQLSAAVDL
jgi:iron complex outermembrane recepter protein